MRTTGARFLVLWDTPSDPEGFDSHYRDVHVPLAKKLPAFAGTTVSRNAVPIRGGDPYYLVAELDFDDMASLQHAFRSPEGQETAADIVELAGGTGVHSMIYELEDV